MRVVLNSSSSPEVVRVVLGARLLLLFNTTRIVPEPPSKSHARGRAPERKHTSQEGDLGADRVL